MRRLIPLALAVLAALGLWRLMAVPGTAPPPGPDDIARASTLRPDNPALAAIYDRSCVTCHALPDAMAPLTGHVAGWKPRIAERGIDGLVASARDGFGNMPAMGLCPDCTEAELMALIDFMSGQGDAS
ncbi:cytochrome c5 family protein [Paracoccus sp. p4-l81]|uniref:c-type cytochrome n=1 Tax=unclassified Paracoccus (in: a-proteobacteria) TaxID=2688777 RepID=UPI0035B8C818